MYKALADFYTLKKQPPNYWSLIGTAIFAFGIWASILFFLAWCGSSTPNSSSTTDDSIPILKSIKDAGSKWGTVGDAFGIVNSLFAGLALCAAIHAAKLQNWQIQDQKKHDRDMLRREKLEEVMRMINEVRTRFQDMTCQFSDELEKKDCQQQFLQRNRSIQLYLIETQLLVHLYFPRHSKMIMPPPEGLFSQAQDIFLDVVNTASLDERKKKFESSVPSWLKGQEELEGRILYVVTHSEEVISGEISPFPHGKDRPCV